MKRKVWLYIGIGVIIFMLGGVLLSDDDDNSTLATTVSQTTTETVAQAASAPEVAPIPAEEPQNQAEPSKFNSTTINGIPVISAEELYEAFKDNEVAANKKYGGKTYCVKGIIEGFQTGVLDNEPIVNLESGYLLSVSCYFSKSKEDEVASLSKGEKVIIQGVVENSIVGVDVKRCKIIR